MLKIKSMFLSLFAVLLSFYGASAHAVVDYTSLTAAADFSGLGTALVGVIVVLLGASLLVAGGMAMWKLVKRGSSV